MEIFGVVVIVLLVAGVGVGLWLWGTYNGLVKLNVRVDEAWSDITVQLKRRADLIPNLIDTVKGYAKHEKEVFENVTKARSALMSAGTPVEAGKAENMMTGALKSLFAVAEAYPQLQASANFLDLQSELTDTENKIMASRRFYNGGVRDLNSVILQFPQNLFVKKLGFVKRDFFDVEDAASIQNPPKVSF